MRHLLAYLTLTTLAGALAIVVAERQPSVELHHRSMLLALCFPLVASAAAWAAERARVWELTLALALMVGGMLGNVWFVPRGGVPDWIRVTIGQSLYLTNVADILIAVGGLLLVVAAPFALASARRL